MNRDRGAVYRSALTDTQRAIRDWVFTYARSNSLVDRLRALRDPRWRGHDAADRAAVRGWLFAEQRHAVVERL